MARYTEQELRYLRLLDELQETDGVDIRYEERGEIEELTGEAPEAFDLIEEWQGVRFAPELQRAFLRFDGISSHWTLAKGGSTLHGEFSLRHLPAALFATGETLIHDDLPADVRALYEEFRVFDEQPRTGAGTLAALRVPSVVTGSISPEVWYYDSSDGALLDIDYAQYLDALLVTKGTFGWQYLYADVDLGESGLGSVADDLRTMLDVFPDVFPGHDYSDLRARLEARL
ncbi:MULTISPECIES: hypothetical protein [Streptomyces]|uniref:SMI1/KNR4 family protein n=1 Tax=Streptomyces koelreuteriae TaxID=2838015 RepID=A0ABX8G1Y1_9ACTN|nr:MULTISPECIES: hypothetical protein [Streptomyces]QWB27374.1 hypothetical protein KJK29_34875 [Streptomyces koelreuteriae]UUA10460.1 hypothetical protein NNW98_35070 [Streptomyces koelreuteriae]UUA18067.1 hypothetical protein NNW99_34955 [Streptomyces sp. CRCS-T-1]